MNYRKYSLLLLVLVAGCAPKLFQANWVKQKSPEYFKARFETTEGNFEIAAERKWSPLGVDRLYQLIKHHYYKDISVYRVEPGFVVQFGTLDSIITAPWVQYKIADEPVIKSNTKGTLAFAISGPQTRNTQLYINLEDNLRLDTMRLYGVTGFPVIGTVTSGMETVKKFYSYGPKVYDIPDTVKNYTQYYKSNFPKMGFITKAYLIK